MIRSAVALADPTRAALHALLRAVATPAPVDLPRLRHDLIARLIHLVFARHAAARGHPAPARFDALTLDPAALQPVHAALTFADALTLDDLGALYESTIGLTLVHADGRLQFVDTPALRRRSGAHYTPPGLTAEVVRTALAPALNDRTHVLQIKLCDPATGAGAFLLEACRQLAAHLDRDSPPDDAATSEASGAPAGSTDALRLVARHCIHGVDRDPLAVAVARLSLSLLTGDPASTYESAIKQGDALVGLPGPHDDPGIRAFFADHPHPVLAFHWPREFPAVFTRPDPGFDCIVGNPPFLGGKRISTHLGPRTRDWLALLHGPGSGNADLAAHFFRRAFTLLRPGGTLGLIATNTITQGDTLDVGLAWIARHGTIYAARTRVPWPGPASVMACVVHAIRGPHPAPILDDRPVPRISAFLLPGDHDEIPAPIHRGVSFTGCDLKGAGFTFDDTSRAATPLAVMHTLLRDDPRNAAIIRPYIGGEEINTHPEQAPHRHVIHFADRTLAEAAQYPQLLKIVEQKVAPRRRTMARELARWPWWQFWRTRARLYETIRGLPRVLVNCQVTAHLAFVFMPPDLVFAHTVNVYAFADDATFAVLQSRVHEVWARAFASSLEDRLRYTPTDCFNNFPLPPAWQSNTTLHDLGRRYHAARADVMRHEQIGLTTLYNRFHAPADNSRNISALRELHAELDRAVLTAHARPDLAARAASDFQPDHTARPRLTWSRPFAAEVLAHLLATHRNILTS